MNNSDEFQLIRNQNTSFVIKLFSSSIQNIVTKKIDFKK